MPVIPDPPATTSPTAFKTQQQTIADYLNSIQDGTGEVQVVDEAYNATNWNGSLEVPTKNAVRDKIEDILDGVTFTGDVVVPAEAYGAGWNGSNEAPTKNDVYDKIETLGVAGFVLIDEEILGSTTASWTFSSIPGTYSDLRLQVFARGTDAGTAQSVNMQFNGDTAANYDRQASVVNNTTYTGAEGLGITAIPIGSVATAGATANIASGFTIEIPSYKSTTFHKVAYAMGGRKINASTGGVFVEQRGGFWRSTSAITSITLTPAAGSWATGSEFRLYGLR